MLVESVEPEQIKISGHWTWKNTGKNTLARKTNDLTNANGDVYYYWYNKG